VQEIWHLGLEQPVLVRVI